MKSKCTKCDRIFAGLTAFDAHFIGNRKEYVGKDRFRCMDDVELAEEFRVNRNGHYTNSTPMVGNIHLERW